MKKSEWQTIPQTPLNTPLDTRSTPADLAPGHFRWKLNAGINTSGRLCRRAGYTALDLASESGESVQNWDFHRRGRTREAANLLFESQSTLGVKRLFAGTPSCLSVLDNDTGEWTELGDGFTDGGFHWSAAELQDKVVFTNNVDDVQFHELGGTTLATSDTLIERGIRKAKIVAQFAGVTVLFNIEYQGKIEGPEGEAITEPKRYSSRVAWGNYLLADDFHLVAGEGESVVAGYYDLDYGDEILNVKELGGNIYIYTRQSIWRMYVQVTDTSIFGFRRFYSDPDNRTGCLAFDNAILSTGTEHLWLAQESIYRIDQYMSAPERTDWVFKASGRMFGGLGSTHSRRIDVRNCQAPVAEFKAATKEGFFFYPRRPEDETADAIADNDYGLVLNTEWKTADYVDFGMTALVSFSKASESGQVCRLDTLFVGASSADYCLKNMSEDVFYRTHVSPIGGDVSADIVDVSYLPIDDGYFTQVIGVCPFGYQSSREKIVRSLTLQHETVDDDDGSRYGRLRIGNSFALADPVSTDSRCAVLWRDIKDVDGHDIPIECPDEGTLAQMAADNQRPSLSTAWDMYEQGRYLYFDLKIVNENGDEPTGCNSAWASFDWDVFTLP